MKNWHSMSRHPHVLIPLDGSEGSEEAFEFALEEFAGSRLTLLRVFEPGSSDNVQVEHGKLPLDDETREEVVEESTTFLDGYARKAEEQGSDVTKEYKVGDPPQEIVEYAEENDVDHIVMGSHGRSGVSRVVLGSVAEEVVRRSPIPVTVVR